MSLSCVLHVAFTDNDSDDEGTSKIKPEKKAAESAVVAREQVGDCGETGDGEDHEEDMAVEEDMSEEEDMAEEEEDGDISQQEEDMDEDLSDERDGRQTLSGCISSRSESKPYSSVTHKCEVRNEYQEQSY